MFAKVMLKWKGVQFFADSQSRNIYEDSTVFLILFCAYLCHGYTGWAKNRLFLRSDNFATTDARKGCNMSKSFRILSRMKCIICLSVQLNILCLSSVSPKLHWISQWCMSFVQFLSASLYFSKRGAYWDRLCRDVVGRWLSRACTVAKRCILGL